jgi:hypothetical protein
LEQFLAVTGDRIAKVVLGLYCCGAFREVEHLIMDVPTVVFDLSFLCVAQGNQTLHGGLLKGLVTAAGGDGLDYQAGYYDRDSCQQYGPDRYFLTQTHDAVSSSLARLHVPMRQQIKPLILQMIGNRPSAAH